jgi:Domain of unknown function (DUF1918)
MPAKIVPGKAGDWIEVVSPGGGPARRGQILEVLGGPHHEHYRVQWMDAHESIHYPSDGTRFLPAKPAGGRG